MTLWVSLGLCTSRLAYAPPATVKCHCRWIVEEMGGRRVMGDATGTHIDNMLRVGVGMESLSCLNACVQMMHIRRLS
jgi:hypothetical protein